MKDSAANRPLQGIGGSRLAGSASRQYHVTARNQPIMPEKFTIVRPPADEFRAQGGPQSPLRTGSGATPFHDECPPRRPVSSPMKGLH